MNTHPFEIKKLHPEILKTLKESEGLISVRASGGSMYPTLKEGDTLWIRYARPEQLKIGDLAAYQRKKTPLVTVHRIVKKEKREGALYFFTKGDACIGKETDELLSGEEIFGKVVFRERQGRKRNLDAGIYRFLNPLTGFVILRLPTVLALLQKIKRIWISPRRTLKNRTQSLP